LNIHKIRRLGEAKRNPTLIFTKKIMKVIALHKVTIMRYSWRDWKTRSLYVEEWII
jgi:hypothetical protein